MKKSIFLIAISLVFSLTFAMGWALNNTAVPDVAYAKCLTQTSTGKSDAKSMTTDNATPDEMGDIPFSLYTARKYNSGTYDIVDYIPSFTKTMSNGEVVYQIEDNSIPYILMSSKTIDGNSTLQRLYDTSLYFKFNDEDINTSSNKTPSLSPEITLKNSLQTQAYRLVPSIDSSDINNQRLEFSVNLLAHDEDDSRIPKVYDGDNQVELGQGRENETAYREGLYTFKISYIPKSISGIAGDYFCTFIISFYVVDYSAYITGEKPLDILNADELNNTGYYLYNYNYNNAPVVKYDASKFALNFAYSVPTSATTERTYYMNYAGFTPDTSSSAEGEIKKIGDVTLHSTYFNDSYTIPVYDIDLNNEALDYTAFFDLADFEQNYILKHSAGFGTSCFQGIYNFNLDMLIVSNIQTQTFSIVNGDTFDENIYQDLTSQSLVIFGYDLRYNDYKTGEDISLKNENYNHNMLALNDATSDNEEMFVNSQDGLITTNLAPLNFHYYGNLSNSFSANFILDNTGKTTDGSFIESYFKDIREANEKHQEVKELEAEISVLGAQIESLQNELSATTDPDEQARIQGEIDQLNAQKEQKEEQVNSLQSAGAEWTDREKLVTDLSSTIEASKKKYTQSSAISGNGIWLLELSYSINVVIDGISRKIEGTQYVAFRIDNTAQMITAHAVELNADNDLENLYTFNQYTKYPIRIATRHYDNSIMAPINVEYRYYKNYDRKSTPTASATLSLNHADNGRYTLSSDASSIDYEYYVLKQGAEYTFSQNGTYVVTVSSARGSSVSSIVVNIESNGVATSERKVYTVDLATKAKTTDEIIKQNGIYLTSKPFTLQWSRTESGSDCYTYVGYMPLSGDSYFEKSMFKEDGNYYISNEYAFGDYMPNIERNYRNSIDTITNLATNQYFKKDGLYFFYVYDKAGNYFTETILLDSTLPETFQGSYVGDDEDSLWVNDEIVDNNYVHKETILYFGTHKALRLPLLDSSTNEIRIQNSSYLTKYDSSLNEVTDRDIVNLFGDEINNDFYKYIESLSCVKKLGNSAIINDASAEINHTIQSNKDYYYFMIPNTNLEYEKIVGGEDVAYGNFSDPRMAKIKLLTHADASEVFSGEAQYLFTLTSGNGLKSPVYFIEMNFDIISGTFYAYNEESLRHSIQKDAGTNLNFLSFEYTKATSSWIDPELADYYDVTELKYDYYAFDYTSKDSSYPFSTSITESADMLKSARDVGNDKMRVDKINVATQSTVTGTKPGKYVITRSYIGGTHDKVDSEPTTGNYVEINGEYYLETPTRTGGSYVILGEGSDKVAVALFDLDSLTRRYTVYVDRNGIISTTYISGTKEREVGNEIKMQLGEEEEEYTFIDFFKTSISGNSLITNKIPVKIEIPYSKYFARKDSGYVATGLNFARLNITITFFPSDGTASKTYTINNRDYNRVTGLCTSQDLISASNRNGDLIFTQNGIYEIRITDNTGYNEWYSSGRNVGATSFDYTFCIEYARPSASMAYMTGDKEINTLEEVTADRFATNVNTEVNGNSIFMTIDDNDDPYKFNVRYVTVKYNDEEETIELGSSTITTSIIESIESTALNGSGDTYDDKNYIRYRHKIYLNFASEGEYEILLSYGLDEDNPSYDFSTRKYIVTIDRSKPTTNIFRLIEDESFLISSEYYEDVKKIQDSFLEENFDLAKMTTTPSVFTYAFPIDRNFTLSYDTQDTVGYFYVRHYNKFTGENVSDSNPSITPDMTKAVYDESKAYYSNNQSAFSGYTKFSEIGLYNDRIELGENTYYKVNYNQSTSLYNLILSNTGSVNGYYEIIERDSAGNYRCYTVYFAPTNMYKMLDLFGKDEDHVNRGSEKDISAEQFTFTDISVATGWGDVVVNVATRIDSTTSNNSRTYKFSPAKNYLTDSELSSLNDFISVQGDRKITLTLIDYNSKIAGISREINLSMGDTEMSFSTTSEGDTYTIHLPESQKDAVVYLTSFTLSVWQNGTFVQQLSKTLTDDPQFFENRIVDGLSRGIYLINYTVNRPSGITYERFLHLGEYYISDEDFDIAYQFKHGKYEFDELNKVYYSGGDVLVTYEANIYVVKVNGQIISGTDKESLSTTLGNHNCKTFSLKSSYDLAKGATEKIGGESRFVIEYFAITKPDSLQKSKTFVIFDSLPEIYLTNGSESSSDSVASSIVDNASQVTNTTVKIDWGSVDCSYSKLSDTDTNEISVATLYKKNAKGKYEVFKDNLVRGKDVISDEGDYKLEISNRLLGNSRSVYFSIKMGELPLYSIYSSGTQLLPSDIETLSLATNNTARSYGQTDYSSIIQCLYNEMLYRHGLGEMTDMVEGNHDEFFILASNMGFTPTSGTFNEFAGFDSANIGISNVTHVDHYYTTSKYEIKYNSVLDLKIQEFVFRSDSTSASQLIREAVPNLIGEYYYTTIYLAYTLKGPIKIKLFAVTRVPTKTNLLNNTILYKGGAITLGSNSEDSVSKVLSNNNGVVQNGKTDISWNTYSTITPSWFNQGNYVYVLDQYGADTAFYKLDGRIESTLTTSNTTSTISGSGTHKLMFKDLAGNVHKFSSGAFVDNQYVYSLSLIDQVIYHVEYHGKTYNPAVQYAVYNDNVSVVIDKDYLSKDFYTMDKVSISVTRNGVNYNCRPDGNILTFTETGKYVLSLNAKFESRPLNTATYNFTILSSTASRQAYEFVEVANYEITRVIKDGEDITGRFVNSSGKVTSLFISSTSSLSGNGRYEVTMRYSNKESDTLTYSFFINDYVPIIYCNVEHGGTTTGDIVLTYDKSTLYEELGKCYVIIKIYNSDSKSFINYSTTEISENKNNSGMQKTIISQSNSYFIQVQTENGNIISSYRIDKTDPLNAFAIIAIVVAVLALVALIIIIVKLRTRMKIR